MIRRRDGVDIGWLWPAGRNRMRRREIVDIGVGSACGKKEGMEERSSRYGGGRGLRGKEG